MVKKNDEVKAAEQDPDTAKDTNPVGEATQVESKDPFAEGNHIANPEPNNGKGEDVDEFDKQAEKDDVKEAEESQAKTEEDAANQKEVEAKANTPDSQLPDEDKTAPTNQPEDSSDDAEKA